MKRFFINKWNRLGALMFVFWLLPSCYKSESLNLPKQETDEEYLNELDEYIYDYFAEPYGMSVKYKFVDSYLSAGQKVAPVRTAAVRPMLEFIQEYWIDPYGDVENGADFFADHVPAEIVLFGGLVYQGNTVLLGLAEAGARITLLNVNDVDLDDQEWILFQLGTIYHEFAHIVHQRYKLPASFETISPTGYTGAGSWYTLTDEEALISGFVSPYGTSSPNEDFAETVAFYLFDPDFFETYIDDEPCEDEGCEQRNAGRAMIRQKLAAISSHYEKVTGVNLSDLRIATQKRILKNE